MSEPTKPTFQQHDKFELKTFSERLEKFLTVEHEFVEGSLVVSLNAPFGSGKSTFLSMWKADLDAHLAPDRPKAVMLNAWESDYCGDPLMSVVTGLIQALSIAEPEKAAVLTEAMKDIGWFVLGLAGKAIPVLAALAGFPYLVGSDPLAAAKLAKENNDERNPGSPDFVKLYEQRTDSLRKLKKALHETFGGEFPKAFVFVDELDRCRPDYAISYLETIKHVFDVHGLVFVLAVDLGQLESSAKALFGDGLNFPEYFRKFVQRSFSLPLPSEPCLRGMVEHYVQKYIRGEGKRFTRLDVDGFKDQLIELLVALKATPRQMQEIISILGHASAQDESGSYYNNWGTPCGLILLSVLKVLNPALYLRIGFQSAAAKELENYLSVLPKERLAWWMYMYVSGTKTEKLSSSIDPTTGSLSRDLASVLSSVGLTITQQGASYNGNGGCFGKPWDIAYSGNVWRLHARIETACEILA